MSEFEAASVVTLLSAVSATGTGAAFDLDGIRDEFTLVIQTTGSPTFSLTLQGSVDGTNWFTLGSAVTSAAAATVITSQLAAYVRADLTALSTGTLTAELGFSKT